MATTTIGARNQYSVAVSGGVVPAALFPFDVPDFRDMLERTDVPMQKAMGTAAPLSKPIHKAEWGWGSPDPYIDTLAVAITDTGATTITVTAGEQYQIGDIIVIDSEEIRVTGRADDILTVVRGHAGTTAATHLISSTIVNTGPAVIESADDADSPFTQGETDHNFHQISSYTWSMSNRADKTWNYEHPNAGLFAEELKKKMQTTAPVRFELRFLMGQRAQGTSSSPSSFGGLRQSSYISSRQDLSDEPFTEYDLMTHLQTMSNLVGPSLMPHDIWCGHLTARIISSWYNATRQSDMSDSKAKNNWTSIATDFGVFNVKTHYLMDTVAPDKAYVMDVSEFKIRPYASGTGWQTGEYTTQGWHRRGYLRGDYTVLAQLADARLEIYNYSTTASDYPGLA